MHFFRHTLFFFIILSTEISAQTLSVQDVSVYSGRQVDLVVKLVGGANMTSLQFNLNLPEGLIVDKSKITLCAATDGHTLNVVDLDSGDQLFVLYHLDSKSFKDGELLRIPLIARYNEGATTGKIYTVRTATADAVSHECMNAVFNATIINETEVKAMSYTREYGDENPKFEYTVDGAVLMGSPEISCDATVSSPVGEYPIVISKGSVTNYNDIYVNGTLSITKAPLTVSVSDYSREQGQDNPEFILNYSGWKNGEDEIVLDSNPTATTIATKDSEPGDYLITVSGGEAKNYFFEYKSGKLTINEPSGMVELVASELPLVVYTITGIKLNVSSVKALKQGVYIVNGRKVIRN